MSTTLRLQAARSADRDEFYTRFVDVENELRHYVNHFRDKTVHLPCDDPRDSAFFTWFQDRFTELGLRRLVATSYAGGPRGEAVVCDWNGKGPSRVTPLRGDGDFRSAEVRAFMEQADVVVTNPPFSLFRQFLTQLVELDKNFLVVGHQNAISYKEVFPLIRQGRVWLGHGFKSNAAWFESPYVDVASSDHRLEGAIRVSGVSWFTSLDHAKRHDSLPLKQSYDPDVHPRFDFYDAINVNRVADIPFDFDGAMGVPLTYLMKHNPDDFEILNCNDLRVDENVKVKSHELIKDEEASVDGVVKYVRIPIRRRHR